MCDKVLQCSVDLTKSLGATNRQRCRTCYTHCSMAL